MTFLRFRLSGGVYSNCAHIKLVTNKTNCPLNKLTVTDGVQQIYMWTAPPQFKVEGAEWIKGWTRTRGQHEQREVVWDEGQVLNQRLQEAHGEVENHASMSSTAQLSWHCQIAR